MNYCCVQRMCLLQEEDGCGYNVTDFLRILAERLWNTWTKIISEGSQEKVESWLGQCRDLPETLLDSFVQEYINSSMKDNVQLETRQWLVECITEVAASIRVKCNFLRSDNWQQACNHKVAFLNFDFTYDFTLTKKTVYSFLQYTNTLFSNAVGLTDAFFCVCSTLTPEHAPEFQATLQRISCIRLACLLGVCKI